LDFYPWLCLYYSISVYQFDTSVISCASYHFDTITIFTLKLYCHIRLPHERFFAFGKFILQVYWHVMYENFHSLIFIWNCIHCLCLHYMLVLVQLYFDTLIYQSHAFETLIINACVHTSCKPQTYSISWKMEGAVSLWNNIILWKTQILIFLPTLVMLALSLVLVSILFWHG
jgi:hypothetical protein